MNEQPNTPALNPASRIGMVDALRGFALLGIILANIPYAPDLQHLYTGSRYIVGSQTIDHTLQTLTSFFIDKKFITIFSILFGFGFSIQANKAGVNRGEFSRYFIRRMLLLLLIGCLHGYLLWFGDITRDYALCGLLLLLVYQWPLRRILWTAVILAVPLTAVVYILNAALSLQEYAYDAGLVKELYVTPSYWRYLAINATIDPLVNFIQDSPLTLVFCSGQILLGYWLGQIGFFANPHLFRKMLTKWIVPGVTVGLLGSIGFWAISTGKLEIEGALVGLIFLIVAGLVLQSLAYIALFIKAFEHRYFGRFLRLFIPVGKMALTNYLMQTVFYLLIFFHWPHGLQLYGKVSITETYLIALAVYVVQVLVSHWWLKSHTQGPVEMVWRKLAYGNRSAHRYIHH